MGAWFSSEADDNSSFPKSSATNGATAPRVNNSAKNAEAVNVNTAAANGAAAPRMNNSAKNAEAANVASNGAAAPRVNNTTRNAEKGNRNNSRKNNATARKNNALSAVAPKINEPSPAGQEEEGFPPNTQVNVKNQAGGHKRKSKSRKGKGRKGKSRRARK